MTKEEDKMFVSLCSDLTFKALYKNEKLQGWFNNIILKLTGIDLSGYTLYDGEINKGEGLVNYRTDILLVKENEAVIIEMNNQYKISSENKNYAYLYNVAANAYKNSSEYPIKNYTTLINFNNYRYKENKQLAKDMYVFKAMESERIREDIVSHEIYLPTFRDLCYDKEEEIYVSLSLFTMESYEEMRKITKNPKDIEIIDELEVLSMNDKFAVYYNVEEENAKMARSLGLEAKMEGRAEGIAEGLAEGREKGLEEGKAEGLVEGINKRNREIIQNMLDNSFTKEQISLALNMSTADIDKLID